VSDHAPPDYSDEQLARAAPTDSAAFAELYRRHMPRIYRYIMARVGTVQDAQDLTAQTFEALLEGIGGFRGDGSFAAWLTIIARNRVVSHYRARRPELSLEMVGDHSASLPPTDELVGYRLQIASVLAALELLSAEHAEVIRLRIFGELSTAETAQVMHRSEAAVKMLLYRALRDLRKHVGVHEVNEVDEVER
jgi:RNA polymerase sigma-70 factor, ECF subfamily